MVNYKITPAPLPNEGMMFVDHQSAGRSGHMSHALVEYRKGHVLAFYSNCSRNRLCGHNGFGWIEYKRSVDGARTWSEAIRLEYAWSAFLNEPFTVSCEKAVCIGEDEIVLFCTRNTNPNGWEPYIEPVALRSTDGGETWSEPIPVSAERGRIYDAVCEDGIIYALMLHCPDFPATEPEHRYFLYESTDGGCSFHVKSELPGDHMRRAYGSMERAEDGRMIVWVYNVADEYNLDCYVSRDMGATWTEAGKSFCAKRIRNPQVTRVRGGYILHGRSGCVTEDMPISFVLYTGEDGFHWDEGVYLCEGTPLRAAFYSNNLVLDEADGTQRVLIQSSVPWGRGYDDGGQWDGRVNIAHWMLEIE